MAKFLCRLERCLCGYGRQDSKIADALKANRSCYQGLWCREGYDKIESGLYLDGYMKDGMPDDIFKGMCCWDKGLTREEYLAEAEKYIDHSTEIIHKRARLIMESLMKYM